MKLFVFVFLLPLSVFSQTITWDGGGDGISWKDGDNWDSNAIPCTSCDVVIANAEVVLQSSEQVKSLNLSGVSTTSLLIEKGSELNIIGASSDGLTVEDNASCLVLGILNIQNINSLGVALENGTIEVQDEGYMQIENTGGHCLNIGASGVFYLNNYSASPSLNLESCSGSAINNNGSFTNNLGEVTTSNLNQLGISNQGDFENNGSLEMNSQSQTGLLNAGAAVFFNNINGDISISGGVDGILNSASITNNGEIDVYSPSEQGIESTAGTVTSEGDIGIHNAGENGISLSGGDLNNIGQLEIDTPALNGILTGNSTLLNTGDILIEDATTYIRNSGQFTNKGSIDLIKTPAGVNAGSGINNQVAGSFINQGDITIEDLASGIGTSGLVFENSATSNITIRRVGTGIVAGASFNNNGSLTIDQAQFYHLNISPSVTFENEADGIITLDSLVGASALGVIQCQSSGTLLNRGLLEIDDKTNSSLYFLGATIHNYGTLNYNGKAFNTVGNFTNFSSGTVDGTNLSIIGGTLNNSGHIKGLSSITADDLINSGLIHLTYGRISGTPIHNMVSGTIRIDDTQPNGNTSRGAIRTEEKLINEGLIQINSSPHNGIQVYDNDSLVNSGSIQISNVLLIGIEKIGGNGLIKNESSGTILINDSDSYGIQTESNFENGGNLNVFNSLVGLRLSPSASGYFINSGDVEFNGCSQQAFSDFDKLTNTATGYILVEACGNLAYVEELDNAGEIEFVNTSHGLQSNQILNSGRINALNVPNTILRNITVASGHTFNNTATGIMDFENVTEGIHFVYASTNHGEIKIDGAITGITSRMDNYGKIEAANCTTALTGGIDNKSGGEIFLDNNTNLIVRTNEACGLIKSTTGYEIQTENYGFISHPDPINANIRVSNYGVFENVKGMRRGQAGGGSFFNNDGLMTGKVNGKPSVLVKELNAMRAHSSFTVSNNNLYTDASLTTLAGGFNNSDNSISLNATGALADTLYTSVSYGSGCNTVIRIPVRQDADCGGVYTTATSVNAIATNFQWHEPESWVDKIVPDGCTNVSIGTAIKIPANSKARAHSIEVLENFSTGTGAILVVDPLN